MDPVNRFDLCVWLLVHLLHISLTHGYKILTCSGEESLYTYRDCQRDKGETSGCYYLDINRQYKPCHRICDGIERWSIDEKRCKAYCEEFYRNNCRFQQTDKSTTSVTEGVEKFVSTTGFRRDHYSKLVQTTSTPVGTTPKSQEFKRIFIVLGSCLTIAVLVSVLSVVCYRHKHSQKLTESAQCLEEEVYTKKLYHPEDTISRSYSVASIRIGMPTETQDEHKKAFLENETNKGKEEGIFHPSDLL